MGKKIHLWIGKSLFDTPGNYFFGTMCGIYLDKYQQEEDVNKFFDYHKRGEACKRCLSALKKQEKI